MRAKTWRYWTVKEVRLLEELRMSGLSCAAIAERLGRTVGAIKARLPQEGILLPVRSVWIDAFAVPHTIGELAAKHGVSKGAVKQAKRRLRMHGFKTLPATRI